MDRKKICFIIFSFLIIVFSIYTIMNADSIRLAVQETIKDLPIVMQERMADIYNSNRIIVIPCFLDIILSIIILLTVFLGKIEEHKKLIIGLSIVTILFSSNNLVPVFALGNIIFGASIKSVKKEKKNIPVLERYSEGSKGIVLAIACLALYFSQMLVPTTNNIVINYVITIIFCLFILVVCLFVFKDNLKRDITLFKKHFREYLSFLSIRIIIIYIIYILSSFIVVLAFQKGVSVNEQEIQALPLWFSIPFSILWAPIVEEILFRGCIRRFIKNDVLFIIVSGVVFGLLHTMSEASLVDALIIAIPYGVLGSGFAYIYSKTNNITNNILLHCFHNIVVTLFHIILF